MAWTSPRTWAVGETVTAALMNTHLRDQLNFLAAPPRVHVTNVAGITHTTATSTLLTWDTEVADTDGMHDLVTDTSRIKAITAGVYRVTARAAFATNATGIRSLDLRFNAFGAAAGGTRVGYDSQTPVSGALTSVAIAIDVRLAQYDFLELFGYQTSGGNLATDATAGMTLFQARWVSL